MPRYLIVLDDRSRQDLHDAERWYRRQNTHLAKTFKEEVLRAFSVLEEAPLRWREWRSPIRRHILHRFPYILYYSVEDPQVIVVALLHQQQDASSRFPEDP